MAKKKEKPAKDVKVKLDAPVVYQPYKCGLCDLAHEDIQGIREHCKNIHEVEHQFKCSVCDTSSDNRAEIEAHCEAKKVNLMRIFYADPSSNPATQALLLLLEEKREPLWRRDMPGLKHIRGILYEDYSDMDYVPIPEPPAVPLSSKTTKPAVSEKPVKTAPVIDEADNFPMKCKECGLQKKTIKGLKMHIKLLHLRTGKFLCKVCQFSANMLNSINTHYKIKHPEKAEVPDYEERSDDKMVFSHEFWKSDWGIPTLDERKEIVKNSKPSNDNNVNPADIVKGDVGLKPVKAKVGRKRKAASGMEKKKAGKKAKKRGPKRKLQESEEPLLLDVADNRVHQEQVQQQQHPRVLTVVTPTEAAEVMNLPDVVEKLEQQQLQQQIQQPPSLMKPQEISPFEHVPTFKCQYCSKRSQNQERIERHLKSEHPNQTALYKTMTRDQVVDLLTLVLVSPNSENDFICFYCDDVVGSIFDIKAHFGGEHDQEVFKVKRVAEVGKKPVTGYLECQVCGYLSPGFCRSKQKVHFHEEHPLETVVNASKYVSKIKMPSASMASTSSETPKFDPGKYIGMIMNCPKDDCSFENTSNAAMNAHLRKHTQTFKCGHCGKTHPNSSEFHRHSAMMHGDK